MEHHNPNDDYYIDLHLYVLGASNAHILLSSTNEVNDNETHYEIVLGAGGNAFSEIRKKRKSSPLVSKQTKGLLSPINPLPINLKVSKEGVIEIWLINSTLPLLSVIQDTDKIELIKYISFTTWGSAQLKWFYDCRTKQKETETEMDFEDDFTLERNTSKEAMLDIKFHFSENGYDKYSPDVPYINLTRFEIHRVEYEDKKMSLKTYVDIQLSWFDKRCTWKPEDYDNITERVHPYGYSLYCWYPKILNNM